MVSRDLYNELYKKDLKKRLNAMKFRNVSKMTNPMISTMEDELPISKRYKSYEEFKEDQDILNQLIFTKLKSLLFEKDAKDVLDRLIENNQTLNFNKYYNYIIDNFNPTFGTMNADDFMELLINARKKLRLDLLREKVGERELKDFIQNDNVELIQKENYTFEEDKEYLIQSLRSIFDSYQDEEIGTDITVTEQYKKDLRKIFKNIELSEDTRFQTLANRPLFKYVKNIFLAKNRGVLRHFSEKFNVDKVLDAINKLTEKYVNVNKRMTRSESDRWKTLAATTSSKKDESDEKSGSGLDIFKKTGDVIINNRRKFVKIGYLYLNYRVLKDELRLSFFKVSMKKGHLYPYNPFNTRINHPVRLFFLAILDKDDYNKYYNKLNDTEKDFVKKILNDIKEFDVLSNLDNNSNDIYKKFNVLKSKVIAGHNSEDILDDLKEVIDIMKKEGIIDDVVYNKYNRLIDI